MSDPSSPTLISKGDAIKSLTTKQKGISNALAEEFVQAAIQIKQRAYCPYSKFRVGAAVLALPSETNSPADGGGAEVQQKPRLFTGVNVENAAYPVGTCAERCAIGTAVAAGYPRIIAIAVSTDIEPPASPCGMCRQFIREFVVDMQVLIVMMGKDSDPEPSLSEERKTCLIVEFEKVVWRGEDLLKSSTYVVLYFRLAKMKDQKDKMVQQNQASPTCGPL